MLLGYQRMPDDLLLRTRNVQLQLDLDAIISRDGYRAKCEQCGEEIINEREVLRAGQLLCRHCAGKSYYSDVRRVPAIGTKLLPVFDQP
jgi:formylmethanofuran dehydrogenase subunit E